MIMYCNISIFLIVKILKFNTRNTVWAWFNQGGHSSSALGCRSVCRAICFWFHPHVYPHYPQPSYALQTSGLQHISTKVDSCSQCSLPVQNRGIEQHWLRTLFLQWRTLTTTTSSRWGTCWFAHTCRTSRTSRTTYTTRTSATTNSRPSRPARAGARAESKSTCCSLPYASCSTASQARHTHSQIAPPT